jgi:hypothetical protein
MADFSIQGKLGLDISGLQRGVSAAQGELKGLATEAAGATGAFGRMAAAAGPAGLAVAAAVGVATIAVGALAAGIVDATKKTLEYGGHLTDLSAKTGISTTALQTLGHVGSMVGVSMDEIGNAVGKMQRNLVNGSEAFAKLGLSIADLRAMEPDKAFEAIAEKITSIKDPAGQAAAAIEIFGRSGASLLPAMKEDMARLREEATRLGFVMSKDMVAAADALGDKFTTLNSTWQGLIRNVGSAVASSESMSIAVTGLTNILGSLSVAIRDNQGGMRDWVTSGVVMVIQALKSMTSAVASAIDIWDALALVMNSAMQLNLKGGLAIAEAQKSWKSMLPGQQAREDVASLQVYIDSTKKSIDALGESMEKRVARNITVQNGLSNITAALSDLEKATSAAGNSAVKAAENTKKGTLAWEAEAKAVADSKNAWENRNKALITLSEEMKKQEIDAAEVTAKAYYKSREDMQKADDEWAKNADKALLKISESIERELERQAKLVEESGRKIVGAFGDMFSGFGLGGLGSGLGNIFESMANGAAEAVRNESGTKFQIGLANFLKGDSKFASLAGVEVGSAFVAGFSSVANSATPGSTKGILPSALAGFQAGAATGNPLVAAAGAAAGAEFALGASGEIKKRLGTIGEVIAGVAFPMIGIGTIFGKLFGGAQETFHKILEDSKMLQKEATALKNIQDGQTTAINDTKAAMDRYGLSVTDMGNKWAQNALDQKAFELIKDYQLLTTAGADHNLVLEKMGPNMNQYVQDSIKAGTTIPESMKPVLQSMLDAGLLTDTAGNKMTDLGGLTFAQTLEQAIGGLVTEIKNLVTALEGIPNIERTVTITTHGKVMDNDGTTVRAEEGIPKEKRMAFGGVSTGPTPAFLHGTPSNPELVGPADALARSIGQGLAAGMAGSGNGAPMQSGPVQLIVDKRVLAEVLADVRRQEMR